MVRGASVIHGEVPITQVAEPQELPDGPESLTAGQVVLPIR